MNQKDAVYSAVRSVFPEGVVPETKSWTSEQDATVRQTLTAMFISGTVDYKGGVPDAIKLAKYIPGLINNWVRKDGRLNGGMKYETKNPGSRAGAGDATLKAMLQLLKSVEGTPAADTVRSAIEEHKAKLEAAKAPAIDVNALPEALRSLVK